MADVVVMNGPRHWMIDSFEGSKVLDPEVRTLGGIEMRKTASASTAALAEASARRSCTRHGCARDIVGYDAGKTGPACSPIRRARSTTCSRMRAEQDEAPLAKPARRLDAPLPAKLNTQVIDESSTWRRWTGSPSWQDDFGSTYQLAAIEY